MDTLYRRPLPPETIAFSSPEGQRVFADALAAGGLGGYFALAEQYQTQSDPAFCGLGSLVVALNALAIDPGRLWKGPWRWFSEDLLDCCVSLEQVRAQGVDLDTLGCLARCNGAEATVVRPGPDDDELRAAVSRTSAGAGAVLVAAYDRAALGQTGSGHFSPLGGYHAARDLVLVMDVARFKYPPHWVALPRLAAAMHTIDPATDRARGWLELRPRAGGHAIMLSLACRGTSWPELAAGCARRSPRAGLTTPRWPRSLARWRPDRALRGARELAAADHAAAVAQTRLALRATEAHRVARASPTATAPTPPPRSSCSTPASSRPAARSPPPSPASPPRAAPCPRSPPSSTSSPRRARPLRATWPLADPRGDDTAATSGATAELGAGARLLLDAGGGASAATRSEVPRHLGPGQLRRHPPTRRLLRCRGRATMSGMGTRLGALDQPLPAAGDADHADARRRGAGLRPAGARPSPPCDALRAWPVQTSPFDLVLRRRGRGHERSAPAT
ncbi:MAG: hypothetical protein HS111_12635 [Kofleriaceae bacterium]|nr:hypothetical protein [Kofleriaceae bacterium]